MNEMVRKATWVLAPVAVVVMLGGLVMAIRADAGPFDGSVVVPTVDETTVGEAVGFALYVVNSSPVTATEVLIWNPLPAGATYVSASGGAFPVLGEAVSGTLPAVPPDGFAYDARLRTSVLLTDTGSVTGIAGEGDLLPGEMVSLGLIVTVDDPAGRFLVDEMFVYDDRELAGHFAGQVWVRPHTLFLPLAGSRFEAPVPTPTPVPTPVTTTVTFTVPYGQGLGFGGGSLDPDYGRALAGADLRFGDDDVYLGQAPPAGPYLPWYVIGRAYAGWDTSVLPDDAGVVSATLILDVGCSPPTTTFGTSVYQGVWIPPLSEVAWQTPGSIPVGTWHTADYPCSSCPAPGPCLVRIDLDQTAVNHQGLTLLEMRSDREGISPTSPEQVLLNRSAAFPALVVTYVEEP